MIRAVFEFAGLILAIVACHEAGHFLAYRLFGVSSRLVFTGAALRVLPRHHIILSSGRGLLVALSGFLLPTLLLVLPSFFYLPAWVWKAALLGNLAGSSLDFLWALNILAEGELVVEPAD